MYIRKVSETKKYNITQGTNTFKQVLISSDEAPNFAMRKFTIEPNGSMPLHTNEVEHEQYILNGKAEVMIGDELFLVKKDDVVYIPKGVKHNYKTIGDENFEFLCIVPNQKDKLKIVE
jgi:quercetin dioxygenase-like cupin family protein